MSQTFTNLLTHIVFGTKSRRPFFDAGLRERLHPYLGGIVKELGGTPIIIGGTEDHCHLLAALKPAMAVADVLRVLKTNSSRWLRKGADGHSEFGWQTGYGAFSVSRSNLAAVYEYIETQEEHHRRVTFKEEFLALLDRHEIEYDPRYVWD